MRKGTLDLLERGEEALLNPHPSITISNRLYDGQVLRLTGGSVLVCLVNPVREALTTL